MTSSKAAARSNGTASPPVNIERSEQRSRGRSALAFSIMMNCVLTQHSTVTRSRSIRSSAASASKWSITTVGQPRMPGVKWPVQSPKPNGAGIALKKTSSSPKSPASAASWWK